VAKEEDLQGRLGWETTAAAGFVVFFCSSSAQVDVTPFVMAVEETPQCPHTTRSAVLVQVLLFFEPGILQVQLENQARSILKELPMDSGDETAIRHKGVHSALPLCPVNTPLSSAEAV
jgi:hypothetical protein